jgi:hypothetical protein
MEVNAVYSEPAENWVLILAVTLNLSSMYWDHQVAGFLYPAKV